MKTIILIACGAGLLAGTGTAGAQTPGAINQVEDVQLRQRLDQTAQQTLDEGASAPELYPGEDKDVGPQSVLRIKPHKTLFEAMADAQYFYTDNMFLNDQEKIDTAVLVSTVEIALAPTPYDLLGGKFAPQVGYRHQWFDYGFDGNNLPQTDTPLSEYDFNAQTCFMDMRWSRNNWTMGAGLDYTRLMSTSDYDQFYQEWLPHWGVQKVFSLSGKTSFSVGYEGNYHFSDNSVTAVAPFTRDDLESRTDQMLVATCAQMLGQHAVIEPYYRLKYTHFTQYSMGSRNDCLNSFGLALYWIVCPNCNVRTFVGYDIADSDNGSVPGYHQFDAGGGVNVAFRF
jgi:hypothetical protein